MPDVDADGVFRFDLDCAFQAVRFRVAGRPVNFYAGSRGGQVEFEVHAGSVLDHTPQVQINVEYVASYDRTRKSAFGVKPQAEAKTGDVDAKISGVEATLEVGRTEKHETRMALQECRLNVTRHAGSVVWDLAQPRVQFAVQDFISGNLALYVTARWRNGASCKGKIQLTPDRLEFYDVERRPLGSLKSLLMWRTLRKFAKGVHHREGVALDFEVLTHV